MIHTVLVISGGGFQGLALVKALRAAGPVRIVMIDCYQEIVTRYFVDAFYPAPRLDPPENFIDFALRLCKREGVHTIFAATEFELPLLDRHRDDFAACGAVVHVSGHGVLSLSRDKQAFYAWLKANDLPVLPCYDTPVSPGASLPLIGKPRHGWGGRDILILRDEADLDAAKPAQLTGRVWQPYLDRFDEYSVDLAVSAEGLVSPLAFRRRVRTTGGFAVVCEPNAPAHVQAIARTVIERLIPLGALGPMNLQLLDAQDGCWVSDLNPRIGTSMPLSLAAGHNPVAWLLQADSASTNTPSPPVHATTPKPANRVFRSLNERVVPTLDLSGVKGVVFDLDDTLIEQKRWIADKLALTWSVHREWLPAYEDFMHLGWRIVEEGNRYRLFDALCAELGFGADLREDLIATYRQARPARASLYPDVLPTLLQLRRQGYRLGLLTDNPPASQRMKIEVAQLEPYFDAIVFTGDLKIRKPDMQAFAAMARAMCLASDDLVMVGDNLYRDIQGANTGGFRHGFFVQREGGFFNFRPELASSLGLNLGRWTRIESLHELFWFLLTPSSSESPIGPEASL